MRALAELIAANAFAAALSMVYVVLIGRALSPAAYGEFAAGLAIAYLIGTAAGPVSPAVAHFVARSPLDAATLRNASERLLLRLLLLCAIVAIPIAIALAPFLQFTSPIPLLAAIAAGLTMPLALLERGVLQGLLRFRRYNANAILEAALRLALGIAMIAAAITSATLALAAYTVALLVALIDARVPLEKNEARPIDWIEIRRYLGATFVLMAAYAFFQNADVLAAKRWLDPDTAGHYGAAAALTRALGILAWPLNAFAVPVLTSLAVERKPLRAAILRVIAMFVVLAAPAVAVFALFPEALLRALYGDRFLPAATILGPLAIAAAITTLNLVLATSLAALREFGFLKLYVAAAVVQAIAFALMHDTPRDLITAMLAVQIPVAILLTIKAARRL